MFDIAFKSSRINSKLAEKYEIGREVQSYNRQKSVNVGYSYSLLPVSVSLYLSVNTFSFSLPTSVITSGETEDRGPNNAPLGCKTEDVR
jgi:hypothetical protein